MEEQGTLALQMDMPRIARKDMTAISEMLAKYRGMRATLIASGFAEDDEVMRQLTGLEQALVATRAFTSNVMQALSMPPAGAPAMSGHSTEDLTKDVERENEPQPDEDGNVERTPEIEDAAAAARKRLKKPPRPPA